MSAILDGELVSLEPDGRSNFHRLMFRRDWPYFYAFDLLSVDGVDLRDRPLLERRRRLKAIMPRIASRLLYVDHLKARGTALFNAACERDAEGIVAKFVSTFHTNRLRQDRLTSSATINRDIPPVRADSGIPAFLTPCPHPAVASLKRRSLDDRSRLLDYRVTVVATLSARS
jgi:bifunctional non-homologous end joining protein LigD